MFGCFEKDGVVCCKKLKTHYESCSWIESCVFMNSKHTVKVLRIMFLVKPVTVRLSLETFRSVFRVFDFIRESRLELRLSVSTK